MENKVKLKENERIDDLQFKKLKIIQNSKGFCFGVDSVLLSDFAKNIKNDSIVMDIGTGTGIIGLLLCKKTNLRKVYGIEIQEEVADMARRSIMLNGLEEKFEIINCNINEYEGQEQSIDVIVTNPPYKKANTGLKNDDIKQYISRHEVECTLEEIIKKSYKLLKDKGEFYMVHRAERIVDIMFLLRTYKMEPKELRFVCSKEGEKPKLVLVKCVKNANQYLKLLDSLVIFNNDGSYTDEIKKIYNK